MVAVEHRAMECRGSFDETHRALLAAVPELKPELSDMPVHGERERIATARRDWPKLWLFLLRDHGALTVADGLHIRATQYEIGNPLTAERMTRYVSAAAAYAPLRVVLLEDEKSRTRFEYDLPSSLFGQFGDDRVAAVGQELDAELEEVLQRAAGLP